jgi:GntR family transcriptional regulator of arabinose operon
MEITIAHDSTIPLHSQLLNQLRHLILSGQWAPGSRLPSETELRGQLNISRSTIRQALSNAEIERLIERVPGKGTYVARSPASGDTKHFIGYITIDLLSSDWQYQVLSGAESVVRDQGYRILFYNSKNDVAEENALLDQLLADKVGGVIIWPILNDNPARRLFQLANQGLVPLMLMDRTLPNLACDYITSNNYAGAYSAIQHLISLGHQRIAFLSHPFIQLSTIAERLRGYQETLQNANLTPLEPWLVHMDQELGTRYALNAYSNSTGQEIEQIARYLEKPQRPTAIFAVNDVMALLVLKAAGLVGLRIPDDLSIVGFDDLDIVAHLEVPLTTVAQDGFALGRRATQLLIERIEGYTGSPRYEMLPTKLQVRASTAPPATAPVSEKFSESVT